MTMTTLTTFEKNFVPLHARKGGQYLSDNETGTIIQAVYLDYQHAAAAWRDDAEPAEQEMGGRLCLFLNKVDSF